MSSIFRRVETKMHAITSDKNAKTRGITTTWELTGNLLGAALYLCINANLAFLAGLGTGLAGLASSAADGGDALAAAVAAVAAGEAVVSEAVEGAAACHS